MGISTGELVQKRVGEMGLGGLSRTRGNDNPLGVHGLHLCHRDLVGPFYQDFPSQLFHISGQVIYKRIIIVQHKIHRLILLFWLNAVFSESFILQEGP